MSLKEIQQAIEELIIKDEQVTSVGNCEYAAERVMEVACQSDQTPPKAKKSLLVYSRGTSNKMGVYQPVHYAFCAESSEETLWVNLSPAPGFPQFNLITDFPPGLIGEMRKIKTVI